MPTSLLLLVALARADQVTVPVDAILFPEDETPEQAPTRFITSVAALQVEPGDEHVEVELQVRIDPVEPGWVQLRLLDGQVRLYEESEEFVHIGSDGHWWFTGDVEGPRTLTLRGSVPRRGDALSLRMAPAVRQTVDGVGEDLDFEVFGALGRYLPPTEVVEIGWTLHDDSPDPVTRVVQGRVATAAWIDEGDLRVRSSVRWTVRRGEADRFEIQLPGKLAELEVSGAGLERYDRSGDRIILTPKESVDGVFEVLVDWRAPFRDKKAAVVQPRLPGTATSTATLTLAGDAELLLSPTAEGLRGAALAELPAHARSVGDATPTAAWTGSGTLKLKALQLSSLEGPELVVDKAVCTEASSVGGRSLLSCQLDVRNASRQFLRVRAPEGSQLWAARVNGEGVAPVVVDDGTMAVPLERSVETLSGLTTLDVELTFVGEGEIWRERRKGARSLALPSIDAPVAHLEWEFRLPPGYEGEIEGGSARSAGEASTEIVYAVTTAEEKQKEQAARDTWNAALRAYQDNDFDAAQSYIDQTLELDVDNDNALRLQTNLDVLSGKDDGGASAAADEAMSRRVKDMAKAKVGDAEAQQADKLEEADQALASGDYDRALQVYEEVEALSEELSRYEQTEQNEQAWYGSASSSGKAEAKKRKAEREASMSYGNRAMEERAAPAQTATAVEGLSSDLSQGAGGMVGARGAGHGSAGLGAAGGSLSGEEIPPEVPSGTWEISLSGDGDYVMDELDVHIPEIEPTIELDFDEIQVVEREGYAVYDYAPGVVAIVEEPQEAFDDVEFDFATGGEPLVDLIPENARRIRLAEKAPPAEPEPKPAAVPPVRGDLVQPQGGPVTTSRTTVTTVTMPALSATTLAIPLPDHGQSLTVVQRLLAPGEVPTLEITYREER